jgi:PPOX class probable F420-dependent enzyme
MDASESRRRFAEARVARLATRGEGTPRLVPIVFAIAGDDIVTAVDHKPKSTRDLRRLSDIADDPRVALLVDHYDDADWSRLWWVRADGIATVHDGDATAHRAIDHLVYRYSQYRTRRPAGPVIAVSVSRWSGWAADPGR